MSPGVPETTGVSMPSSRTSRLRNQFLTALVATLVLVVATNAQAQDKVLRVGTLKLIHGISAYFYEKFVPPGYTVEVIPFESPTDGKNAVLTGTVDACIHGIAAFILGAAAGEPVMIVASANNGGMAIMAGVNTDIKTIKDLKGKKVAIWPGSTQEAIILERLRMEGMTIKDIQPIRLSFSDMAGALARGDVDAYVGAEPAGGISLANGTGKLVEYPYSTPIGPLNMIVSASQKAVKENPERIKLIVDMHRKAVEYAMANQPLIVDMAVAKLGQQKKSVELAVPNVELVWKVDDVFMQRANAYAKLMFENKQIRQEIDLSKFVTTQFQR
jgi:NitT/TauT family transport system substrate-binding protein